MISQVLAAGSQQIKLPDAAAACWPAFRNAYWQGKRSRALESKDTWKAFMFAMFSSTEKHTFFSPCLMSLRVKKELLDTVGGPCWTFCPVCSVLSRHATEAARLWSARREISNFTPLRKLLAKGDRKKHWRNRVRFLWKHLQLTWRAESDTDHAFIPLHRPSMKCHFFPEHHNALKCIFQFAISIPATSMLLSPLEPITVLFSISFPRSQNPHNSSRTLPAF